MKRAKTDVSRAATGKPQAGTPWHGDETRPGPSDSETPEDAASRAEGNVPISVREARRRIEEPTAEEVGDSGSQPHDSSDSEENAEEKREAAAEEHAAEPWRRYPHGKL